ncbi:protein-L-isoaspartate O-methyltransferase [Candidatus Persebacteraceae bacterium Df01]|uniref:Protein-L-isoaspartate O-methyltransferase n=1 Tax=Candidatus Doriopsillibacter californiensis TaxID=2970740 RepID=A0ABT7QLB4_9GAMM|nr:protein-L-isoaspartate O-methyltransferase [Candidatus Persebacteraceae bacterium Df01]
MVTVLTPPTGSVLRHLNGRIRHRQVLEAFERVNRSAFLDSSLWPRATADSALPIGFSQTTSQPLVIARMIEMMLRGGNAQNILEVGAGCGYQTALLAEICAHVTAVERIGTLARQTNRRLRGMGYNNVRVVHADGVVGCTQAAPYDGIIVCAEHKAIPSALVEQLSADALLVMPLEDSSVTRLVAINAESRIAARRDTVNFVPLLEGKC